MRANTYPATVAEVLRPPIQYPRRTVVTVRRLARSRPWRGTMPERMAKFERLHRDFCQIYGKTTGLVFGAMDGSCSGRSHYIPSRDAIVLIGRLSVVTMLHEWGHVLHGHSERRACRWSIQLFARCFPRSFARCTHEGHVLVARQ